MVSTRMSVKMWTSCSCKRRSAAATRLGISVKGVIPTTNHLESLNGALKRKYIPQWQHSGHRLRFDILLYHLVTGILPQIYAHQRMLTDYPVWKARRFQISASGSATESTTSTVWPYSHRWGFCASCMVQT